MVEVGVYQGDFSAALLEHCESITRYYMLDSWRHLPDWNKPFNTDNTSFERFFEMAKKQTEFAAARRVILRGTTTQVIDQISNGKLDFAYLDGDHTLRGNNHRFNPCLSKSADQRGFIGGDDFSPTLWNHQMNFEPPRSCSRCSVFRGSRWGPDLRLAEQPILHCENGITRSSNLWTLRGQYSDLSVVQSTPELGQFLKRSFSERFPRLAQIALQSAKIIPWR